MPLAPDKTFPDAAYAEILGVFDCEQPRMAMAENTVVSKSGEVLYHYKWADPRYLNLAIGMSFVPGTVLASERTIVCHDEIRTPLLGKKQVATMSFASLSSTVTGDGDIFYAPISDEKSRDGVRDALVIFRMHKDTSLVFPGIDTTVLPKYRIEVDHVKLKCFSNAVAITATNFFDASYNLVQLTGVDPSTERKWREYPDNSPYGTLQRIVCPSNFVGIGIQVVKDSNSLKVVKVFEETPAQKGGVKVNDVITYLDDNSVDGMTLDQAVEKMRGQANTKIKLRIVREGQSAPIELSVARGVIDRPSVQPSVQAPSAPWPSAQGPSVPWPSVQVPSVQWPSVQGQVQ
jgi:hypothetical protein